MIPGSLRGAAVAVASSRARIECPGSHWQKTAQSKNPFPRRPERLEQRPAIAGPGSTVNVPCRFLCGAARGIFSVLNDPMCSVLSRRSEASRAGSASRSDREAGAKLRRTGQSDTGSAALHPDVVSGQTCATRWESREPFCNRPRTRFTSIQAAGCCCWSSKFAARKPWFDGCIGCAPLTALGTCATTRSPRFRASRHLPRCHIDEWGCGKWCIL